MHPYLVLNGTESRLQITLFDDSGLLCHQEYDVFGRAASILTPALREILGKFDLKLADISGVAVARGPGSFTGLRVVLATACGLCQSLHIPMAGLCSLYLLAHAPGQLLRGRLAVLTHSRRRQVYAQCFSLVGPEENILPAVSLGDPLPLLLDDMPAWISEMRPDCAVGSGVRANMSYFQSTFPDIATLATSFDVPSPDALMSAARCAEYGDTPITPLYLRASDAEDNLDTIAKKIGLDPDEAKQRLEQFTTKDPTHNNS
ncbi:tRNA (adenosine(37)-N6)-threonylcarbamoyltransferase complex dimerization subunit type 1 TsaB [Desulfovibrio inopinatus]|uniref:tRNA (adenosine(37)-N6)-threonylcarbamoyltransferase complex dimerization subunit type 1 TsaB n=1 Tax=Desulfovibrio inopinatus TaxID=102109 RepID=UPI000552F3B1|nr:tRNA (adenosine(37)-N6)-threonylcarbamoyltransferase complex dimerization subunit type 1 TsaB [Desulfovibrio inopinatus]